MCNHPTNNPPTPNPALVGIKMSPADAGDQSRTAIAYVGVKKSTAHRAIIRPRPDTQVNKTLRLRSSFTGITGSSTRFSTLTKTTKKANANGIGHNKISGDARLKRRRTTDRVLQCQHIDDTKDRAYHLPMPKHLHSLPERAYAANLEASRNCYHQSEEWPGIAKALQPMPLVLGPKR